MFVRISLAAIAILLVYIFAQPLVAFLLAWLVPPPPGATWYSFTSFGLLRDFSFETSAWEAHVLELLPTALALMLALSAAILFYTRRITGGIFLGSFLTLVCANLLVAFLMQGHVRRLYYATTPEGLHLASEAGGGTQELTAATLPAVLFYVKGCNRIENPHLYRLFDRQTGRPLAWYLEGPEGNYTFYDSPCYDPRIGIRLPRVSQQVFAVWATQRSGSSPTPKVLKPQTIQAANPPTVSTTDQREVSAADLAGFYIGSLVHPDSRRETVTLDIKWPEDGTFSYVMNSATHQMQGQFRCDIGPCSVSIGDSFRFVPARGSDGKVLLQSQTTSNGTTIVSLRKRR